MLPRKVVRFIEANLANTRTDSQLIAALHLVQDASGYLPQKQLKAVSQLARIPLAKVMSVATFYHYFRLAPPGKHMINLCLGTACHVKGAGQVCQRLMDALGIQFGETTPDGEFSLEPTRCLGTCGLAPVGMIDRHIHGPVTPGEVPTLLEQYLNKGLARPAEGEKRS